MVVRPMFDKLIVTIVTLLTVVHLGMAQTAMPKTIITSVNGKATYPVVLHANSHDSLIVSFDLLEPDMRYIRASITPLTLDLKPSRMTEIEFLQSFNRADVSNIENSQSTVTTYTHYQFILSNENLLPTISGNYRLDFVDDDQMSDTILSLPFYVSESNATFFPSLSSATDQSFNQGQRQLSLQCNIDKSINDLNSDNISLAVFIDGQPVSSNIHPTRLDGNQVIFEHQPELIFKNGNIWRRFDITDSYYPGHGISIIQQTPDGNHRFLIEKDIPRVDSQYQTDGTLHGSFIIDSHIGIPETNADYCDVVFTLDIPFMPTTPVAIRGEFTRYLPGGVLPMTFDSISNKYKAISNLKQGVYNYQYLVGNSLKPDSIEGNFNETPLRYDLLLYYTSPTVRYPRIIGHHSFIYNGN
ncbi:MAG: DUF5103 domain-containing protein [Muribaculaceae bacterium]|nr:DUF5103 domain-containing protein [Muribaculaceae bacterium]